jgi:hypothetical protein
MAEKNINLTIEEDALKGIRDVAASLYQNKPFGLLLYDPSCCGGIVQIHVKSIEEIESFRDVSLVFKRDYKNYGFPIYIDRATLEDPIPDMLIVLSSKEPIKFTLENAEFYKK